MSKKLVFGDKATIGEVWRDKRPRLSDPLEVAALKAEGRAKLQADLDAWDSMRVAAQVPEAVPAEAGKRVRRARINTIAPSNYLGSFRVIYSGIDSYSVNVVGALRYDFMVLLDEAQEDAKVIEDVVLSPFPPFLGENLSIRHHGGGTFRYLLSNADVTVKVRKADHVATLAAAQVELSAACLHRVGYRAALLALAEWVGVWAPASKLQVSEVDLCADTQGWQPNLDDFKDGAFVCPVGRPTVIPYEAGHAGYVRFGTGGKVGSRSGQAPVQLAIYDKTDEIQVHDKGWFVPLWAGSAGYVPGQIVTRVEFRYRREWLKERGIETQADLLAALDSIWAEGLEWCRYCVPPAAGEDGNRSRLVVRDEWRVLRSMRWTEQPASPLSRIHQARPRLDRTLAALGGHFVTLQALMPDALDVDLSALAPMAVGALKRRWDVRGEDYASKVEHRRLRMGGLVLA
jgi:hypothetical protein